LFWRCENTALVFFSRAPVLVRGGGDLASGAIFRLHRAGFPVVVMELPLPVLVRRAVSFGEAVYSGSITVEGVTAQLAEDIEEVWRLLSADQVPVLVDPHGAARAALNPVVLVDARMAKVNLGTTLNDAPLVVALGPGFTAGVDCHAVVETHRGHNLGRALFAGAAEPDTGEPGIMGGFTHSRVLRAPADGQVQPFFAVGDVISAGTVIATVAEQPVMAAFDGVLRGLIHEQVQVRRGDKIGDLDPRAQVSACFTISDKSLAVGGGVLEAVLAAPQVRPYLLNYETSARI
jgi:xanthine dehydrogenase accessory factor